MAVGIPYAHEAPQERVFSPLCGQALWLFSDRPLSKLRCSTRLFPYAYMQTFCDTRLLYHRGGVRGQFHSPVAVIPLQVTPSLPTIQCFPLYSLGVLSAERGSASLSVLHLWPVSSTRHVLSTAAARPVCVSGIPMYIRHSPILYLFHAFLILSRSVGPSRQTAVRGPGRRVLSFYNVFFFLKHKNTPGGATKTN